MRRRSIEIIHQPFEDVQSYKEVIKDVIKEKEGDISSKKTDIKKRIIKAKNQLENAQDKYFSGEIESETFNNAKGRYTKIIGSLERDLNDLNVDEVLLDTQINFSFNLLRDLDFYYLNASTKFKGNILGSIFPENLIYFDKNYRTPNSDSVISLIANIAKVSRGSEMQKVTNNGDQSLSAPRVTQLSNSFLRQLKEIYKLKSFINVGETKIIGHSSG